MRHDEQRELARGGRGAERARRRRRRAIRGGANRRARRRFGNAVAVSRSSPPVGVGVCPASRAGSQDAVQGARHRPGEPNARASARLEERGERVARGDVRGGQRGERLGGRRRRREPRRDGDPRAVGGERASYGAEHQVRGHGHALRAREGRA